MINIIKIAGIYMLHMEESKSWVLIIRKKKFSTSLMLYLYKMMDVHETSCGHHFMMHESQIIMLYTWNLYSVVCQLYLNKTGRKKSQGW